ncbi:MAG TPA: hypothetical protein VK604_01420 [Bryobacteraceae bacterium]|nr:hypothetical protein [Bryobacteraceae bacterium]
MARRGRKYAERLFSKYDSYSLRENQRQLLATAIAEAAVEEIRTGDPHELAKWFADQFSLEASTLLEGALSITAEEAEIDVTAPKSRLSTSTYKLTGRYLRPTSEPG